MRLLVPAILATFVIAPPTCLAGDKAPPARETVVPKFNGGLPNVPGKSFTAVLVEYPPGGKSAPHRHARSAFVYAYVVSGSIRSQVDDQPVRVYEAGESFVEMPGAHHVVSENASRSKPASLLAIFITDSGDSPLTVPDGAARPSP